jgi:hypothetical protein
MGSLLEITFDVGERQTALEGSMTKYLSVRFILVGLLVFGVCAGLAVKFSSAQAAAQSLHGDAAKLVLKDIQVLVAKREAAAATFKMFTLQAQAAEKEHKVLTERLNASIASVYATFGISPTEYDINLETGELIKLQSKEAAK